jgi:hypothetical protein
MLIIPKLIIMLLMQGILNLNLLHCFYQSYMHNCRVLYFTTLSDLFFTMIDVNPYESHFCPKVF